MAKRSPLSSSIAFFGSMLYSRALLSAKMADLTGPRASPSGAKPYFFCITSGISRRRRPSICHCGPPVHSASVPQQTRSTPIPLIRMPIKSAQKFGSAPRGEGHGPLDSAGAFEVRQRHLGVTADVAISGVIDDEIELRPILGGLADVRDVNETAQVGKLMFDARRKQPFMNADILDARFHHSLVTLVGDLLVVHPPRVAADLLMGIVADGVALAGFRLQC